MIKKDLSKGNLIESLIKSLPGLFVLFDLDGNLHWWNNRLEYYSGYTSKQIESMKILDFFDDPVRNKVEDQIENVKMEGIADLEIKIMSKETEIPFLLSGTIVDLSGDDYIIATGVDISSKENEYLKKIIHEKNLLFEEVHHRIKNNLTVASSLLNMQAEQIKDKPIKNLFNESERRIRSMAMIHQMLYEQKRYDSVKFQPYVFKLIEHIQSVYNANEVRTETLVDDDIYFDVNSSIPCALIIHELVSNAFKYNCHSGAKCLIKVSLTRNQSVNTLTVWNSGNGSFDINKTKGLGMTLVKGLTAQVGGTLDVSFEDGVSFVVKFKSKGDKLLETTAQI
ncbi:MAG: histidine kinase dimerization/phosphoacceptor domain -containing protein [Balneolales bacterium]